ncbi:MAG: PAS domain-containing protein [Cyclobacteriaceae bacterium]|nr:PAS domain-containing protein [Cyclobacteriaceae bacterium]
MKTVVPDIQKLLQVSGDLLLLIDRAGTIVYKSEIPVTIEPYFQKTPAVADSLCSVVTPDRGGVIQLILHDIIENKRPFKSEAEFADEAANTHFISITYLPQLNRVGDVEIIYVLMHDISQQKIFERKLSAQAKSISNLIELAHAVIIGIDTRGYITDWNTHSALLTGYTKNEAYTKKFKDLLLLDTYKPVFENQLKLSINGKSEQNFEVVVKCKNGMLLTVLVNITPRTNSGGQVIGSVVVGHDVTELVQHRKTLEEKVQERNRELMQALKNEREMLDLKKRLTALASKELYAPLVQLHTDVELLTTQLPQLLQPEIETRINHLEKRINQLMLLVDGMLRHTSKTLKK